MTDKILKNEILKKLITATKNNNIESFKDILKQISQKPAERNEEENDILETATFYAASEGRVNMLLYLEQYQTNLIEDSDKYTYLNVAILKHHYDAAKYLADIANAKQKMDIINDALTIAAYERDFDIMYYLIHNCEADTRLLSTEQLLFYQALIERGYTPSDKTVETTIYDKDLQYQALEQACKQLGMDSHITIIQSVKDCRTDADKKAYSIIGKPFAVKRSYLNCNSLDATFFYNNEGEATYTYCGYGDPYDSKDKLLAAFETADNLRRTMDEVLQELVKSKALEEEQGNDEAER